MYGMSRVFLGDQASDALEIPDGLAKHVVRAVAPGCDSSTSPGCACSDRSVSPPVATLLVNAIWRGSRPSTR